MIWQVIDWLILLGLAACVVVWPTQWIGDGQNRWLRIGAVGLCIAQVAIDGPRMPLYPAYLIAALFAILLVFNARATDEPSASRERKEGTGKRLARWGVVAATGVMVLISAALCVVYPRAI